jgi:hypothetical protein
MSENEYIELIDFLGKNFENRDKKFENVDSQLADIRREMGVL